MAESAPPPRLRETFGKKNISEMEKKCHRINVFLRNNQCHFLHFQTIYLEKIWGGVDIFFEKKKIR